MTVKRFENLVLPLVLIATGFLLLSAVHWGITSLARMQDYWPAALIFVGLAELHDGGRDE